LSDEGDAVELYMKCTPADPGGAERYRAASPAAQLPVKVPLLLAIGDKDADVPPDMVLEFHASCAAARTGLGLTVGTLDQAERPAARFCYP
jgi:pimeloyl-ACP methyl ester carboxylesterase